MGRQQGRGPVVVGSNPTLYLLAIGDAGTPMCVDNSATLFVDLRTR